MKSNYKKLGDYIREVNIRNTDLSVSILVGVSMEKTFISSVANIVDTDMSVYKILKKGQLACKLMSVGRDEKLPVDLYKEEEPAVVSSAYYVFEPIDTNILHPEYLFMWLCRPENDRYIGYISGGDVRGGISWNTFCEIPINVPSIEKQREIVKEYNIIKDRIELNNKLIQKLEETAQAIYKQWFVDFEFPDEKGQPYKSSGGQMIWCEELDKDVPKGWKVEKLEEVCTIKYGKNLPTGKLLNEGYYVFGGNGIIGKYSEYIYENPQVLIACRGAASGKINISYPKSYITNNSIIFENNNEAEFVYLKYFALNNSFEGYVTGSAQPQITIENIKDILLLWPNNEKLLLAFSKKINIVDNYNYIKKSEINVLLEVKNLLLSKLATVDY